MTAELPVTQGMITITACEYQPIEWAPDEEDRVDGFPEFLLTGKVKLSNGEHDFQRKVRVELDGRDAEHEHVSGFDLDDLQYDRDNPDDAGQAMEDLYNAIYGCPAYREAVRAYHGGE